MKEQIARVQDLVDRILLNRSTKIEILEAGCGSMMNIHFGENAHITGIDISQAQILRNQDIDKGIVGDIQLYDFQPSSFDLIICWNVLEHVQNPTAALSRFAKDIKQDGIIILHLPNVFSIKGLLTKYTPYAFHVWAYRHIFGNAQAGKDDNAPFRTVLSYTISPASIKRFASHHGLRIIYFASYVPEYYKKRLGVFFKFQQFIKYLSFGALGDSDFVTVLQKV